MRYLPGILIASVVAAGMTFAEMSINNRNARRGLIYPDAVSGRTVMPGDRRLLAFGCLALGLLFLVAGIVNFQRPGQALPWSIIVAVFGGGGIGLWMSSLHRWEWDEAGIRWIGVLRSRRFTWSDVVATGSIWIGERFYFAKSSSGERIWWSQAVLYRTVIDDAIQTWRPDLFGLMHTPGARTSIAPD